MSTTDPVLARQQRAARSPGAVRVVVLLVLVLGGGLMLGFGWGRMGMLDIGSETAPPALAIVGVISGLPIAIISTIVWAMTVSARSTLGTGYALAVLAFGAGFGVLVAAGQTGRPAAGLAIGGALTLLGVLLLLLAATAVGRRRRRDARAEELKRTGRLTTATVSDKGYDEFRESLRILTAVTFTFHDLQGVQRWVQQSMVIDQADPIEVGQETRLWYDESDPGNLRSIVVELAQRNRVRARR